MDGLDFYAIMNDHKISLSILVGVRKNCSHVQSSSDDLNLKVRVERFGVTRVKYEPTTNPFVVSQINIL